MQTLLVGPVPSFLGYHHNAWVAHTARALKRLGHRVTVFPYREIWPAVPGMTRPLLRWSGLHPKAERTVARLLRQRDRFLLRLARRLSPDLVLVLKDSTLDPEQITQLKQASKGPVVTWWVDNPWIGQSRRQLPLFDHVFIFDRSYLPELKAAGVRRAHFLPCACDETVFRPLRLRPAEVRRFGCDISLVGWYFPERAELVRALCRKSKVGVWGGGWQSPESKKLLGTTAPIRGGAVRDRIAARIYNASRIGLNRHHTQTRLGGLNIRTFELLASGLLPLVDRIPGMEELLQPDQEVACYGSVEEACTAAQRYLQDPGAASRIAARGRERVLSEHTYLHRMRALCEKSRA